MAKFHYVEWLVIWLLETSVFKFEWDKGNSTKSVLKHGVTAEEVQEVFILKEAEAIGIQFQPKVEEERAAVVGPTSSGCLVTVVFTLREGKVRPISSRPANKKERQYYEKVRKIFK